MKDIQNVELLNCDIWETLRFVKVTKIDIEMNSSLQYRLIPTYSEHEFMHKIGSTKYTMKTWIKKVESLGNGIYQLYDYSFFPSFQIKLSDEQVVTWKENDKFIEFV